MAVKANPILFRRTPHAAVLVNGTFFIRANSVQDCLQAPQLIFHARFEVRYRGLSNYALVICVAVQRGITLRRFHVARTSRLQARFARTRIFHSACVVVAMTGSIWAREGGLKTAAAVLDRYKEALGGADVIKKVQSETVRGEIESSSTKGKGTFTYYARPFKSLIKITRPDGTQ